ncbi:MAG TPA: metal ABC transporter permease [Candidatus Alistipes merdigallinarum]|nr:metal ABC transporter permease [Candidatus Alistipes merdigallinarum]
MEFLQEVLQYKFLIHAVLASVLCGVACGMVGTYVVCRRLVFLSGGITHSSFGGVGIAYYLGLNPLLGAFCFAVLSAIGIEACAADKRIREDSAIGLIWSLGMAVGIIFVYMTPGYAPNLMSFLFGNILSVTVSDLIGMAVVVAAVVVVFALFYRPVMYVAFDREYAASQNVPTRWIGYLMAVLIAVTIVISIRVVGIVLLISLLTMPAVIANQLTRSFGRMMAGASVVAVAGTLIGLYASYLLDIPSGAATIFVLTVALIIVKLLPLRKFIRKRNENGT